MTDPDLSPPTEASPPTDLSPRTDQARRPDVPLTVEMTFELPGSPEQVWDAIATANGMSSWFLPTDVDEREGGALLIHMGPLDSEGTITRWDPPRRLVYEEDWASLTGHDEAAVTPLVSEFVVEAQGGGTCVLRVVSSAFGTGADWEHEFFEDMEKNWRPFFDNLRLYLEEFPGQKVTSMDVSVPVTGTVARVLSVLADAVGGGEVGSEVDVRGLVGRVRRVDPLGILVHASAPVPGFLSFSAYERDGDGDSDTDTATASIMGWFFSPDADAYVRSERQGWTDWLQGLAVAPA